MSAHEDRERDFAGGDARRDEPGAKPRFTRTFAVFLVLWLGMLVLAFILFGFLLSLFG
ncbi:MAG: hypothetical protein IPJ77_22060 [Planctomycetes bacterium]|nr:hypothetical protein [Planctomycetota bacterium]